MPVLPVATLTIRDLVRRRVFVTLGLFSIWMILLSFPLRQLTIGQGTRLITDIGFGATDLCATLLAIFLGATLISGDLDRRTLYPLLAKPISRVSFVVGKFVGLAVVLLLLVATMSLGILAMLKLETLSLLREHPVQTVSVLQTASAVALHAWLCGGLALFFSCFTSTTLAATFSLALAFIGHTVDSLVYFATKSQSVEGTVVQVVARFLPNLERLNLKTLAAHEQTIPWDDLGLRGLYALAYAALAIALGAAIFSRRDLK